MGSQVSPVVREGFQCKVEQRNRNVDSKSTLFYRYIDDILFIHDDKRVPSYVFREDYYPNCRLKATDRNTGCLKFIGTYVQSIILSGKPFITQVCQENTKMSHGKSFPNGKFGKLVGRFYRKKSCSNSLGFRLYKFSLFQNFRQ